MAQPSPILTGSLAAETQSPPQSASSSPALSPASISKKRSRSPLSIDLSSLPPLQQPAPPTNTLIITRLDNPKIFHPASLATIREHISSIALLNSFSPLKSMHRIIVSFLDTESCVAVRSAIDGTAILGKSVAKCYFGEPTSIDQGKKYLDRPDAGRLFFISPPPSPPVGWEMRSEDPPNKEVHAEDLAAKLDRLTAKLASSGDDESDEEARAKYTAADLAKLQTSRAQALSRLDEPSPTSASPSKMRSRSSTLIYDPVAHGDSPALPAVLLETEDDSEVELDSAAATVRAHTARPPVELMHE